VEVVVQPVSAVVQQVQLLASEVLGVVETAVMAAHLL
jgi:hypothetical protein